MAAEDKVTAQGISGAKYEFDVWPWGTEFNSVGGVYIILKKQVGGNYDVLYVGRRNPIFS